MCTNIFVWLLKILCQTFIAFDQNKTIYDKKSSMMDKFIQQATYSMCKNHTYWSRILNVIHLEDVKICVNVLVSSLVK